MVPIVLPTRRPLDAEIRPVPPKSPVTQWDQEEQYPRLALARFVWRPEIRIPALIALALAITVTFFGRPWELANWATRQFALGLGLTCLGAIVIGLVAIEAAADLQRRRTNYSRRATRRFTSLIGKRTSDIARKR